MVLNRDTEQQELQDKYQGAVQGLLSLGIPIYYSETNNEKGRIIKRHPDGRLEYVNFDRNTGKERILGPIKQGR